MCHRSKICGNIRNKKRSEQIMSPVKVVMKEIKTQMDRKNEDKGLTIVNECGSMSLDL